MSANMVRTGCQNRAPDVRIALSDSKALAGGGGRTRTYPKPLIQLAAILTAGLKAWATPGQSVGAILTSGDAR